MNFHEPHAEVLQKVIELYSELYEHGGYGSMSVEIRFLKKGQKEILVRCGKDFRFVLDYPENKKIKVATRVKSMQVAL